MPSIQRMLQEIKKIHLCLGFRLKLFVKLDMLPELINTNAKQNVHGRVYIL